MNTKIRQKTIKSKSFDSVKMMRDIRAKISEETSEMNFTQLKEYIKSKLKKPTHK